MSPRPYGSAAVAYLAAGYSPLPLPPRKKASPPEGYTGRNGRQVTAEEVNRWEAENRSGNICLRLPPGVAGIDVDAHKDEQHLAAWLELLERCGPLPAAPWCSSRDDGVSGIRLFRVPEDWEAAGKLPEGSNGESPGEVIQWHHRYVVCPPSIHPDSGRAYRWRAGSITKVAELPALPQPWLDALGLAAVPAQPVLRKEPAPRPADSGEVRPGDDFNERADWMTDILGPHGWTVHHETGGTLYVTRPGKTRREGHSATIGHSTDGVERLYVFSADAAPFEMETPYTKFAAHALLNHGGDWKAATRELGRLGYGTPAASKVPARDEVPWPAGPAGEVVSALVSDTPDSSDAPAESELGAAIPPEATALAELRNVPLAVEGDAERFLAASVIIETAVRRHVGVSALIALKHEAKKLNLMNFGEFDQVAGQARVQGGLDAEDADAEGGRAASQATRLVNLAVSMYEFGSTQSGDAFAVPRESGRVVRMLRGGRPALRPELSHAMYAAEGAAPNGSAMSDAIAVLEGLAQQADPTELALRTARHDGALLLDLGDVTGRVVQITPDGWDIIERSPVLFRRTAATLPLPEPVGGDSLDDTMFALLNVAEADRPLMRAVLVHFLWPDIGHVITRLTGRDGTAKTWATRIMRSLIDPSAAPTRAMPKDEIDWIVAVNAALIAAVDNVSAIPDWLSDAMCRASTGEGLIRRKLYTDQDVSILSARRVVILNGIDATIRRADFARRTADFQLEQIKKIKSDSDVADEWAKVHPHALGALLDTAVATLKRLGGTCLAGPEQTLTMGDFARITKAVEEPALKLYMSRLGTAAADVVEQNPFARALVKFMEACPDGKWTGLAGVLVTDVIPHPDPMPKGWPQDPTRFGVWVNRFGRVLETAAGIRITKLDRIAQGQPYTLERISSASPSIENGNSATSDAQLQQGSLTSDDTYSPLVAGDVASNISQLHSTDQRECSSVADVANLPALQDGAKKGTCQVCGGRLDPKLASFGDTTHPSCEANPDGGRAA